MATQYKIEVDGENEKIVIRRVNDATGSDASSYPKITISLGDLVALTGSTSVEVKFREFVFLNSDDDCNPWKIIYLGTAAVAV